HPAWTCTGMPNAESPRCRRVFAPAGYRPSARPDLAAVIIFVGSKLVIYARRCRAPREKTSCVLRRQLSNVPRAHGQYRYVIKARTIRLTGHHRSDASRGIYPVGSGEGNPRDGRGKDLQECRRDSENYGSISAVAVAGTDR